MFSRFNTIPACDEQTDGQTESLYQRRASAWLTHVKRKKYSANTLTVYQ